MGLPVTVFRSTDEGAPVVAPTKPSDWLAIFKACLVDGYGSKQPLGWTLEFEDLVNFKAVFKNDTSVGGSGGALQVQAHAASDAEGQLVRLTAAIEITTLDTFVEKCGYRTITTRNDSIRVGGWTLIGCGRSFYVRQEWGYQTWATTTSSYYDYMPAYWIGDMQSVVPNDQHIFTMLSGGSNRSASVDSTLNDASENQLGGSVAAVCQLYAPDGSGVSKNYSSPHGIALGNTSSGYTADSSVLGVPMIMIPAYAWHNDPKNTVNPSYRGTFPGLYTTNFPGYWGATLPIVRAAGNDSFEAIFGRQLASYWVQTTGEWYD
ncbi:hypothetical protein JK628_13075 [Shewanella sp. KX20019]|uniref:hypothetical protein n=1 Tax=Shewanella sp. KX20019 TaxID=2803864 RepID=UPI0019292B40|nr:hypothetical protein [Shewanella sp. KX20019]QQX78514.1 hypothetical protein JK628_13075 [Shewanella sp. KX20019]